MLSTTLNDTASEVGKPFYQRNALQAWLRSIWRIGATLHRLLVLVDVGLGPLAILLLALLFTTLLEGLGIGLLVPLFGLIVTPDEVNTRAMQWMHQLVPGQAPIVYVALFAGSIIVAMGLKNLFSVWTAVRSARLQRDMTVQLRARLLACLEHAPLSVFERTSPGTLASLFGHEVSRTVSALAGALSLVQVTLMGGIYFAMLAWISGSLGLYALACGGAIAAAVRVYSRHLESVGQEVTSSNLRLAARLTETFAGVRATRIAHAECHERTRVEDVSRVQAVAEERHLRSHAALQPMVESLAVVAAMLLVGGAEWWLVVPGRMTPVALMGFGFVLLRLLPLVKSFYGTQAQLLYFAGGADAILEWLRIAQYPTRPFGSRTAGRLERALVIQDLQFAYDPSRPAVTGLSLAIQAHELIAVVGRSGSGKSTLAALLLRLYEPEGGRILVDGCDYWDFSGESWHRFVAFVEQDPFIFNDTVAANVAYGCPSASPEEITRALAVAQLEEFVTALPQGLETELGERGVAMSGGQRQRLAIARAIVRDPELLILDEATSHLDTISESQLQRALLDAARGRTTLVIAHRLSTIKHADHIVVMEGGRVVEQGRWSELESTGGVFHQLLCHDLRDA
jgi:subfamily B ATP-binding cassette protein MsbA